MGDFTMSPPITRGLSSPPTLTRSVGVNFHDGNISHNLISFSFALQGEIGVGTPPAPPDWKLSTPPNEIIDYLLCSLFFVNLILSFFSDRRWSDDGVTYVDEPLISKGGSSAVSPGDLELVDGAAAEPVKVDGYSLLHGLYSVPFARVLKDM